MGNVTRLALAALRDPGCKNDEATIARALEGTWRDEHLFELSQAYELYRTYQMKVTECDRRIEQALARLPDRSAGAKPEPKVWTRGRKPNNLRFDGTDPVFRALGVDLTAIEGIEVSTALVILGEIGVDVSKFPTEKHFASWLGLCPNHQESNRKRKSRRVRKGKNRVAIALRLAARSLHRSHSALGALLPAHEQPTGVQRGDHGDGAQAGAVRLCHAQAWPSLRQPESGTVRGGDAGADRTYAPKESPCSGLRSGSQAAVKPSRTVES